MTVDELIARQEIADLSAIYMRGLDRLDRKLLRSVFHDDAELDYGFFKGGPDGFVEMAHGALRDHADNHHMLGQILLKVDGDRAAGEVYFQAFHRISGSNGAEDLFIAGRYVDRYEKRDGVWRIAFRAEVNDWARTEPAADRYFHDHPEGLRGARAPGDLSCKVGPGSIRG